jgi:hypothetical protein
MPNNEGWRGNLQDARLRLFGDKDWRIGTDYIKKNQRPSSNQFQYRHAQCDRHPCKWASKIEEKKQ